MSFATFSTNGCPNGNMSLLKNKKTSAISNKCSVFITILVAPHLIVITYIWEKNMIVLINIYLQKTVMSLSRFIRDKLSLEF